MQKNLYLTEKNTSLTSINLLHEHGTAYDYDHSAYIQAYTYAINLFGPWIFNQYIHLLIKKAYVYKYIFLNLYHPHCNWYTETSSD
jgi:hypothetical protein